MADPFVEQLFRSPWSGAPARGQLPQVPANSVLPTASAALAGCLVRIPGGSGVADATYECQKQADGTYAWVQIDGGSGPGGYLGQATGALATLSGTPAAICTLASVTVAANRAVKLTCRGYIQMGAAGQFVSAQWYRDGTGISGSGIPAAIAGSASQAWPMIDTFIDTPTAGAHTYSLRASSSGSGSAGATIYIEDIGAAV